MFEEVAAFAGGLPGAMEDTPFGPGARLAGAGFPSPPPLPCFDGMSWTPAVGWLWEVVSFVPGHAVGWAAVPPMDEIGALLGRYHVVAGQIQVTGQRPAALPLAAVPPPLAVAHA